MGYYFDRCPQEKVDGLAGLCITQGMNEDECEFPIRQWTGRSEFICLIKYNPNQNTPVYVQTWPGFEPTDDNVKKFFKQIIEITGTENIYKDSGMQVKIDMSILD